jgi:hypothetical protein
MVIEGEYEVLTTYNSRVYLSSYTSIYGYTWSRAEIAPRLRINNVGAGTKVERRIIRLITLYVCTISGVGGKISRN